MMSRKAMQVGEECSTRKAGGEVRSEERLGVCFEEQGEGGEVMAGEAPVRAPLVSQCGLGVCDGVGRLERC